METYDLADLLITQDTHTRQVPFSRAKLLIVSEYGTRSWYIDIEGVDDDALLRGFAESPDIGVDVHATTIGGRKLAGSGFFHPNPRHKAAAIRGDGQLDGYGPNGRIGPNARNDLSSTNGRIG